MSEKEEVDNYLEEVDNYMIRKRGNLKINTICVMSAILKNKDIRMATILNGRHKDIALSLALSVLDKNSSLVNILIAALAYASNEDKGVKNKIINMLKEVEIINETS